MDDASAKPTPVRLTTLAHGGGCGCKIAPAALQTILAATPAPTGFVDLLVGAGTSDDAAVWRLNARQAAVATTDFFTPIVDDPRDLGRIAATNALSDIYAMGARPLFALAIVGMPVGVLPAETIGAILAGGASVCAAAGAPVVGGHSIDSAEPIYGLAAFGLGDPDRVLTNAGGRAGDILILSKALGVGVLSAAFRQDRLDAAGYAALLASTTQLNDVGPELAELAGVHAMTDVTGFGLLGHALEMARGAGLTVSLSPNAPQRLVGAEALAAAGVKTGAGKRNWASYGASVLGAEALAPATLDLMCDPQTSGGLLVAVAPEAVDDVLRLLHARGFDRSSIVGRLDTGPSCVRLDVAGG